MTEAERGICKIYLEDLADLNKSHSCNEYKMLMGMLDAEPCEDTISRQAAKEAYCKHFCHRGVACPDNLCKEVNEAFDELPSTHTDLSSYSDKLWRVAYVSGEKDAQSEIIRCKDCIHCADDWNGNQPMFTCELSRCGESVQPNDFCSKAERRTDGTD